MCVRCLFHSLRLNIHFTLLHDHVQMCFPARNFTILPPKSIYFSELLFHVSFAFFSPDLPIFLYLFCYIRAFFFFILVLVLLSSLLFVRQTGMCAQCVASKTKSFHIKYSLANNNMCHVFLSSQSNNNI